MEEEKKVVEMKKDEMKLFEERYTEEKRTDKQYVEKSMEILEHTQLVKPEDFDALKSIKDELNHNFQSGQMFRSRVEMEVSVLNDAKFPSPDAKYWQSVREQNVHFSELVMLSYEYRKSTQKLKIMEAKKKELEWQLQEAQKEEKPSWVVEKTEAELEMKIIDIERQKFISLNQSRTARERIREVLNWHDIMQKLLPQLEHGIDTYEDHQLASYRQRFLNQINIAQTTGAQMGPAEATNLLGQFNTTDRVFKGKGLLLSTDAKAKIQLERGKQEALQPKAEKLVMVCSNCRKPAFQEDSNCRNCGQEFKKEG
jgi:cytochrome c553